MNMKSPYRTLSLLALLAPLAAAGCSSHSLRSGIWELSVQAQDYETHEAVEIPPREVRLAIEWDDENAGLEAVELEMLGSDEPLRFRSIYGQVKSIGAEAGLASDATDRVFHVPRAGDTFWQFNMIGEVKSDTLVSGTRFMARHKQHDKQILTGRWELKWLRDE
ncbi:MAG: hypothetical protein JXA90_03480 [Planctomycetes bacterium]|nr:hypothetical protein [Planctomycetota bacterium]